MKKLSIVAIFIFICCSSVYPTEQISQDKISAEALTLLHRMSLKEKIGQKLMLDFRYWCSAKSKSNQACVQDFTVMNSTVKEIVSKKHIGGIILFSNNLKNISQITTLTESFQQAMYTTNNLPLLIGTDQEGGIVARLPRDVSVSFPGNMALTAAAFGEPGISYTAAVGKIIAMDLKAVGINTDFAPDVDVNINPLNPVIHVRSFSDDPQYVAKFGLELTEAISQGGVAATIKHFPGHGDTVTDSHVGLPVVSHDLDQAWKIDLYPFKEIIENHSPELIMTAHIQFPALDDSQIYAGKAGREITTPATLSRKIQYDLLREQLGYKGVIVTDALDMGAIAQNFDPTDATIKAFQAGDDIALMPINISQSEDIVNIDDLIAKIEKAVLNGTLSRSELDQSVLRIIKLKIKLGLFKLDSTPLDEKIVRAQKLFADKYQHELESSLANDAVTLVHNFNQLVPIKLLPNARIHILTPWLEQGAGIAAEIKRLQEEHFLPQTVQVSFAKMADTDLAAEKIAIDNADIVIVGNITTKSLPLSNIKKAQWIPVASQLQASLVFPEIFEGDSEKSSIRPLSISLSKTNLSDDQFAFQALQYASDQHKKTIFISLLAPYDLPNYIRVSDAMLAGYDYYGYLTDQTHGYYRGPSMQALTRVIFGFSHAKGKLPINIPDPNRPGEIFFSRGYGITT